jgi:hypothetical protein
MADRLYDTDILVWSERQADLLRRLAAGERVNEGIDWPNVIEEVRDLGLSELRSCKSWISLACLHLFKLQTAPGAADASHWTTEIEAFLTQLQNHYTPSMRQRIEVAELYRVARRRFAQGDRDRLRGLPEECPYRLEDFLSEETTVADLLAKLSEAERS